MEKRPINVIKILQVSQKEYSVVYLGSDSNARQI